MAVTRILSEANEQSDLNNTHTVPTGYKRTGVGIIPQEWAVDTLESVTPRNAKHGIVDGPFGSNLKTIHYRSSGIPIITSGYVTEGVFEGENYLYVDEEKFRQEKRSAVSPGDIVMAKIGARCGASAILPEWHEVGILSGNALKISVDESRHSTYFIWQILWNLYANGEVDTWRSIGAQPAISMPVLKKHLLPLPPLPEQEAIAEALADVDALLAALDKLIAKKRAIKQAAMQQLLTGKTRLPGFTGEWFEKPLGEFAAIRNQKVYPANVEPDTLCVELEHIGQGNGQLMERSAARNSTSSKYRFYCGDVLFGRLRPYLRKYWHAEDDGICTTEIWPLIVDPAQACSGFLFALVQADRFIETASISYGTHMPRADWNVVKNYEVNLPPVNEQVAIVTVLFDMDVEIIALEKRRDKTQQIKQGMMQQLLTGRIRLQPAVADVS